MEGRYDEESPLLTSTSANNTLNAKDSDRLHLKTYSAGEDARRLAAVARELGLARHRAPKPQVRRFGDTMLHKVLPAIAFQESEEHSVWETVAGVAGNVLEW